jgi:hypothetical protein
MGQKIRHLVYRGGNRQPWKIQQYDNAKYYSSYFLKYLLLTELFEFISKKNLIKVIFNEYFKGESYFYQDINFDTLKKNIKTYELQTVYSSQLWLLKLSKWQILHINILKMNIKKKPHKYIIKFIRLKMLYNTFNKINPFNIWLIYFFIY